ncbi:RNA polymerase sigma factor SigJ [Spirillospora sp. CA-294931]|uniref:RNA polymerase sigma factor SigJ n=1 Tax=Spirillospora sp. CA-294931 TaxID=3240042 RepID=UPI003D90F86B
MAGPQEQPEDAAPELAAFGEHRSLLFTIAYDMLGSVADAEDVVQETWLRWAAVDHDGVRNHRAYMVRITTHLAMERIRRARGDRERYIGPWLPEPLWTDPDPTEELDREDDVSLGLLVVLETLTPLERAAFVLREAFAFDHGEIAQILDRSPVAVRQLTHRARQHVEARRPRFEVDPATARDAAERFVNASLGGSISALVRVLAPDVTLWTDGGGKVRAALRPVHGAEKVSRLLSRVAPPLADFRAEWAQIGGTCQVLFTDEHGRAHLFLSLETDGHGREIRQIYGVFNPDKLAHLVPPAPDEQGGIDVVPSR